MVHANNLGNRSMTFSPGNVHFFCRQQICTSIGKHLPIWQPSPNHTSLHGDILNKNRHNKRDAFEICHHLEFNIVQKLVVLNLELFNAAKLICSLILHISLTLLPDKRLQFLHPFQDKIFIHLANF